MKDPQSHRSIPAVRLAAGALFAIFCQVLLLPTAAFAVKVDGQECAGDAYPRGDHWACRTHSGSVAEGQKSDVRGPGRPSWGSDVDRPPEGCESPSCAQAARTGPTNPRPQNVPAVLAGLSCREGGYAEYQNQHFECRQGNWRPQPVSSRRRTQPVCVIHCHRENGVLVCYGNGPQCNDVDPWGR